MASVTKRPSGRFLGRYRDASGKERTKTFTRRGDAIQWAQEQERKVRKGDWSDPSLARVTVAEWAEVWRSTLVVKPSTRRTYEGRLTNQVLPRWGDVRLEHVTRADVRGWVAQMSNDGQSPSSIRASVGVLSRMLDQAIEDGRLTRNAAKPLTGSNRNFLPKLPKDKTRTYLTPAQLEALADAAGSYGSLIRLLGYAGLRWGEAAALRVQDVDVLHRRVSVRRSVTEVSGRLEFGLPKTHATRVVPITSALAQELEELMHGRATSAPLFLSPGGEWLRLTNFKRRTFVPAVDAANIPRVTPHGLRHTAASIAVSAGANVKVVQKMLGHASAAMTLDVYADLFDDDLEGLSDRLSETAEKARADYLRTADESARFVAGGNATHSAPDLHKLVVPPRGFEPPTCGLGNRCSIP